MNSLWRLAVIGLLTLASCSEDPTAPDVASLQITDVTVGTGATATAGMVLTVHYTGWLYDDEAADYKGSQFDSSRTGNPFQFTLGAGSVIDGWEQGVAGMKVGGRRILIIPSRLGYGSSGIGPIPPNAGLVFDIELLNVQ